MAKMERPILFSGDMVKAILEGRKSQTRRVINPQPRGSLGYIVTYEQDGCIQCGPDYPDNDTDFRRCPYGKPGDSLWVRESLAFGARNNPEPRYNHVWRYAADNTPVLVNAKHETDMRLWAHHKEQEHCPSIHMPRWASRINLEITQVRVQCLQEINYEDAKAEGIKVSEPRMMSLYGADAQARKKIYDIHGVLAFRPLWDSINKKRGFGWEVNPWVWAISFKIRKAGQ